ncbi:conserved hypothetical protein [Candidatus Methylobacter favarea]|uniref:DUF155 domain-containing protein n=1 Tax=Candidatus Methylobacter favarea TaxID=2707345 RepID=A0A8S0X8Z5_9GAMM|nr:RMD1 family protein [Candidatus Methylobacter favarea]CAA9891694.1 conserved hypothetical protein [Candidatus Methylobacter favarea]
MIEDDQSWSVIFTYGAVVHWNISFEQRDKLHQLLLDYAENPLETMEEDNFTFALDCANTRIVEDHIEIESSDPMLIFSLSQGMAQSIKLASFETNAITTINKTNYIPRSLAQDGRINLSRHEIAKIRGQLFLTKSDIILNYDLLDTPDFFGNTRSMKAFTILPQNIWKYPNEPLFYRKSWKPSMNYSKCWRMSKNIDIHQNWNGLLSG